MKGIELGLRAGQWRLEQEVGSGTFGIVTAWKNEVTNEKLVVKQCRHKLDPTNHSRWVAEIKLMNTMQHSNLVSGRKIPDEIVKAMNNPENLLGLEFCDNDLRKLLNNPSYCCGLEEKTVLNILHDVSHGIRFLHEKQYIIHRDLKPENILLSHQSGETVYKITDLGYAKSIDIDSICKSFVGTPQYLAPELYDVNGYTCTVDYWSFGTVMFECITGLRPFLLTDIPIDWYKYIKKKKDSEIWGCYDEICGTRFFTDLPTPNQLCEPVMSAFKDWLQLVLKQDSKKRGRNDSETWFSRAESILQLKIIHVFDMLSCKDIAYEIQPGEIGSNLKHFLEKETKYGKEEQLLVFASSGNILEDGKLLEECFSRKDIIYLFTTNKRKYSIDIDMPAAIREIVDRPDDFQSYVKLKKSWAHCLFYSKAVAYSYKCLLRGQRSLIINMMNKNKYLQCLKDELMSTSTKLQTVIEVYSKCSNLMSCEEQNSIEEGNTNDWNGLSPQDLQMYLKSAELRNWLKNINSIQEKCSSFQKSPMVRMQQEGTELDRLAEQAAENFSLVKSSKIDLTEKLKESSKNILNIASACKRHKIFKAFHDHLSGVMSTYDEIVKLHSSIEKEISKLKEKYNLVMQHHLHRHRVLWMKSSEKESSQPYRSSGLLSSLQSINDDAEVPGNEFANKVGMDLSSNFKRLGELIKDERETETLIPPYSLPSTCMVNENCSLDINAVKRREIVPPCRSNESLQSFSWSSISNFNSSLSSLPSGKTSIGNRSNVNSGQFRGNIHQYASQNASRYGRNVSVHTGPPPTRQIKIGIPSSQLPVHSVSIASMPLQSVFNANQSPKLDIIKSPPSSRVEYRQPSQPEQFGSNNSSTHIYPHGYPAGNPKPDLFNALSHSRTHPLSHLNSTSPDIIASLQGITYSQIHPSYPTEELEPSALLSHLSSSSQTPSQQYSISASCNELHHSVTPSFRENLGVSFNGQQSQANKTVQNVNLSNSSAYQFIPHHPSTYPVNEETGSIEINPSLNFNRNLFHKSQHLRAGNHLAVPNITSYNVDLPGPQVNRTIQR